MGKNNKMSQEFEFCGKCGRELGRKDKYCRFCGTKRGEGKFKPEDNDVCCVYGPPIKMVYSCRKCKHKWATVGLGGDPSSYCPDCGAGFLFVKRTEVSDIDFDDIVATDYSEDFKKGTQVLTEEEIQKIIDIKADNNINVTIDMLLDGEEAHACEVITREGFADWKKAQYTGDEITEREAFRAQLERDLMCYATGNNIFGIKKQCPVCKGKIIAGIKYKDMASENDEYMDFDYSDETGDGLYIGASFYWRDMDIDPLFKCMQCANKFR